MRYISWILFIATILEIMSIILVTHFIGGSWTLFLMIISVFCGLSMLRNTGISGVFLAIATITSGRQLSLYQLLWPFRYILAAILLISPGFFSDLIAAILMLPISGKPLAAKPNNPFQHQSTSNNDDIIEGEFTVDSNDQDKTVYQQKDQLPPK